MKNQDDNAINRYIRKQIQKARIEANENQSLLAKKLKKSRVAISDIERGRTVVNASTLVQIAYHYKKPISYFFPNETIINLTTLEEELLELFKKLPAPDQFEEIDHLRDKLKKLKDKK